MQFNWKNAGISEKQLNAVCKLEFPFVKKLAKESHNFTYGGGFSSLALPFDEHVAWEASNLSRKFQHAKLVVVIGIGGSSLGSQAIVNALGGSSRKVMWADAVDLINIATIKNEIARFKPVDILFVLISKSGKTLESLANFQLLYKKGVNVVVISEVGSPLNNAAVSCGYDFLPIPAKISGRYSVFSHVGIFPLLMTGVNVSRLLAGARQASAKMTLPWRKNPALVTAALLYSHAMQGNRMNEVFCLSSELGPVAKWYRQLLAESTGKEKNLKGQKVNEGITPLMATPVDLHSQAQLYFGGKNNRLFFLLDVVKTEAQVIPQLKFFSEIAPELKGKTTSGLTNAISTGFKHALIQSKRPFVEFKLEKLSEEEIGELIQTQMAAVMILCHLLKVNAFDQPNVEGYKAETKKQLMK